MARRLRVSQPTYSKIERGLSRPSRAFVERVARMGQVPMTELLAGVPATELSDAHVRARQRRVLERRLAHVEAIARERLEGRSVNEIAKARGVSRQRINSLLRGVSLSQFIAAASPEG